jgi:hypothetical protein
MNKLISKSLVSVATATILVAGFAGCGDTTSQNSSSSAQQEKQAITGTVVGLVQDTNGQPLVGATVSLAGQTATTDATGSYIFNEVVVSNVAGADAPTNNRALIVSVSAGTDYLGGTVLVTPEAQIDDAESGNVASAGSTNGTESFFSGFTAQAQTAVLPKLDATVTGYLEHNVTEENLAGVEVALDFTNVNGTGISQAISGNAAISYAVKPYTAVTDENGKFTLSGLPNDANFNFVVGNYNVNTAVVTTTAEVAVNNLGDIGAIAIISNDVTPPVISRVDNVINDINTSLLASRNLPAGSTIMMLEDDVRNKITINFSETISKLSENDIDNTASVRVYNWSTKDYFDLTAADAVVLAGNTLTITLPQDLTTGQEIDVNLLVTDHKDSAANKLALNNDAFSNALQIDSNNTFVLKPANTQSVRIQLMAFNDLNLDAKAVTAQSQMEKDTKGIATDGVNYASLRAYSNAFNDVDLVESNVSGLNVAEADQRLTDLVTAQGSIAGADIIIDDSARITFTPSAAASYNVTIKDKSGVVQPVNLSANRVSVTAVPTAGVNTVNIKSDDKVTPVELVLLNVTIDDVVTITPINDDGYEGTAQTITLVDNVAATTVLQHSYLDDNLTNAGGTITAFGEGGELANNFSQAAQVGTPILALTPGLLDNLDGTGNNILSDNAFITGDQTLIRELFVNNGKAVNATTPAIDGNVTYDTTAYKVMIANLTREIGVAFSEDVNVTGLTPTFSGTTVDAALYVNNNNVVVDDSGTAVTADLVNFTTTNVLDLANNNHGVQMSFDGIKDAKGNVASNADVVLEDRMPPFVTKAEYKGTSLVITFNEAITAPTTGAGNTVAFDINNSNGSDGRRITLDTATISAVVGSDVTWSLSTDSKVLTIGAGYLALTANSTPASSLQSLFNAGSYIETDYAATAKQHAKMTFNNFADTASSRTNTWTEWEATKRAGEVSTPTFAIVDLLGAFAGTIEISAITHFAQAQVNVKPMAVQSQLVWDFTHPIANFASYEFNATSNKFKSGATESTVSGTSYSMTTGVSTMFAFAKAGAGEVNNTLNGTPTLLISADRLHATLTFTDMNDTSNYNGTNAATGDALKLRNDNNVTSSLTGDRLPTQLSAKVQ